MLLLLMLLLCCLRCCCCSCSVFRLIAAPEGANMFCLAAISASSMLLLPQCCTFVAACCSCLFRCCYCCSAVLLAVSHFRAFFADAALQISANVAPVDAISNVFRGSDRWLLNAPVFLYCTRNCCTFCIDCCKLTWCCFCSCNIWCCRNFWFYLHHYFFWLHQPNSHGLKLF